MSTDNNNPTTLLDLAVELHADPEDMIAVIDGDLTGTEYDGGPDPHHRAGNFTLTDEGVEVLRGEFAGLPAPLTPEVRAAIERELYECRQVQAWTNGSRTRSKWADELVAILAATTKEDADFSMGVAEERAYELAGQVLAELAGDVEGLRDQLDTQAVHESPMAADAVADAASVDELIEVARRFGLELDAAAWGSPDGWTIDQVTAEVFVACRTWGDEGRGLVLNLDTGEVTKW